MKGNVLEDKKFTGRVITTGGYIAHRCVGHPRASGTGHYVFEHILVMERYLGRHIKRDEVVHHINHNRQDNRIENLQLMTNGEHSKHHNAERHKEIDKRLCNKCGQKTTVYRKDKSGYKSLYWFRNKDGWKCSKCYHRDYWWAHHS